MINLIKSLIASFFVILAIAFAMVLIPKVAHSSTFDVDNLSIKYMSYTNPGSDPLVTGNGLPNRGLNKHLSLNVDTSIYGYMYLNATVHSDTDYNTATDASGQFRSIGLQTELGVRIFRQLDLFIHHHSQHVLDYQASFPFPVQDAIGIRINLIKSKKFDTLFE